MTLKNLQSSLEKIKTETSLSNPPSQQLAAQHAIVSVDVDIACVVIDILFNQIDRCIQQDRSRIKINMLTKGMIGRMLGDNTRNGVKEYLINMYDDDVKELLTDMQKELDRRKI